MRPSTLRGRSFGRQPSEWCAHSPNWSPTAGSHAYRAQLLLLHGDWAGASAAANLAEERLRAGDFTAGYVAAYQLAELHRLRGETGLRRSTFSAQLRRDGTLSLAWRSCASRAVSPPWRRR